jgi:hypothetical protein
MLAYRIFEEKDGVPHTLFHGNNNFRKLVIGKWITAEKKNILYPTYPPKEVPHGFHVFETLQNALDYMFLFKHIENKVICRVHVENTNDVGFSPRRDYKLFLAEHMFISKNDWEDRLLCQIII